MRLMCTVERHDRGLASCAMRGNRPVTSVLSIGKKSSGEDVSILHQPITNKDNFTYKVKGNILKVFSKFIEDGKTTISFANPPHDLMIKTKDIIQLKSFLSSIRLVLQGKELSRGAGGLSSLDTTVKVKKLKTKLVVKSKSEYPTLEGFPRTLQQLHITGIDRSNFDDRILKLSNLQVLDLSNNKLKVLPRGLGDLPNLTELYLSENQLGTSVLQRGAWDWLRGSKLPTCLKTLDLRSNNISLLPSFIRDCSALETLKVDSNQLAILPSGIGKMQSLRILTASGNQLKFLPGSMRNCRFILLDLSHNPFTGDCLTTDTVTMKTLTLKELAARSVIACKIPVSEATIPYTVLRFIQGCDFCMCGFACFNPASSKIVPLDIRKLAEGLSSIILGPGESSWKPFRVAYCIDRCSAK